MRLPVYARYIKDNERIEIRYSEARARYYTIESPWKYELAHFIGPWSNFRFTFFMLYGSDSSITPPDAKSWKWTPDQPSMLVGISHHGSLRDGSQQKIPLDKDHAELITNAKECLKEFLGDIGFDSNFLIQLIEIKWTSDNGAFTNGLSIVVSFPESQKDEYDDVIEYLKKSKDQKDDLI